MTLNWEGKKIDPCEFTAAVGAHKAMFYSIVRTFERFLVLHTQSTAGAVLRQNKKCIRQRERESERERERGRGRGSHSFTSCQL